MRENGQLGVERPAETGGSQDSVDNKPAIKKVAHTSGSGAFTAPAPDVGSGSETAMRPQTHHSIEGFQRGLVVVVLPCVLGSASLTSDFVGFFSVIPLLLR